MILDPRQHPFRADVAADHLKGQVTAERFAKGKVMQVSQPVLDVFGSTKRDSGLTTQLLMGETFVVYDTDADGTLAWGQADRDGYVGYVSIAGLDTEPVTPTHRVTALSSHLYPEPNFKTRPMDHLSMMSLITVSEVTGQFARLATGGFVPLQHLSGLDDLASDPVTVASRFEGVPYLWGGRSALGLDCSGLMQTAFAACGIDLPRDSDQQEACGVEVAGVDDLKAGDLVFWKGHVGIMRDAKTLLHANSGYMTVCFEPLGTAVKRITDAGDGQITSMRRIAL